MLDLGEIMLRVIIEVRSDVMFYECWEGEKSNILRDEPFF